MDPLEMYFLLKMDIFHCYVSLAEGYPSWLIQYGWFIPKRGYQNPYSLYEPNNQGWWLSLRCSWRSDFPEGDMVYNLKTIAKIVPIPFLKDKSKQKPLKWGQAPKGK